MDEIYVQSCCSTHTHIKVFERTTNTSVSDGVMNKGGGDSHYQARLVPTCVCNASDNSFWFL